MTKEQYDNKVSELSKLEENEYTKEGRIEFEKFIDGLTKLEQELGSQLDELLKANNGEETDESDEVEGRFIAISEWLGESMEALSEWPEDE